MVNKKLIFIVGPTAVGKSEIAFKLAERIGAEIISCDSMQVYRYMEIINQSPPKEWQRSIPHYLVGILSPEEEYNAAQFRNKSLKLIEDITQREKIPLIVGGSGLYMKALLDGLFPSPEKDIKLRQSLQREAEVKGTESLYFKLQKVDPDSSSRIHPNDLRRVIRALEVYYLTHVPFSQHKEMTKGIEWQYDVRIFGFIRPREVLYKRINERVDRMFEEGLVDEVKRISEKKLSITAGASLGYREVLGYLNGKYCLEEAKELLKRNTRRLAKRQLTWFRADKRIRWFNLDEVSAQMVIDGIEDAIGVRRATNPLFLQSRLNH